MALKLGKWARTVTGKTGNSLLAIYSSELRIWPGRERFLLIWTVQISDGEMELQFKFHLMSDNLES